MQSIVHPMISTLPSKTVTVAIPVITISEPGGVKATIDELPSSVNAAWSPAEFSISASFVVESSSLSATECLSVSTTSSSFAGGESEPAFASLLSFILCSSFLFVGNSFFSSVIRLFFAGPSDDAIG